MSQASQANIDLAFNLALLSRLVTEQYRIYNLVFVLGAPSDADHESQLYKFELLEEEIQNTLFAIKEIKESLQ